MHHQPRRLKQALGNLRQALEETESALLGLEETFFDDEESHAARRPQEEEPSGQKDLLSVTEVCQELGMGKSWVHHRLKSGEIPNIRLGNNIKVRRGDLEEYLESSRYLPPEEQQQLPRGGEG